MKKLFATTIGAMALLASGAAAAIPITTGLTLSEPTTGTTLCTVACIGTITIDSTSGPINSSTNGTFDVIGLNIEITDGNPAVSTGLIFGNIVPVGTFSNYVNIVNGTITDVYAALSTSFPSGSANGLLSIAGNDWTVSGDYTGGGSASAIPEPSALALLGIGVLGFGAASRRKRKKNN